MLNLRSKPAPNAIAAIEPKIVKGSGTGSGDKLATHASVCPEGFIPFPTIVKPSADTPVASFSCQPLKLTWDYCKGLKMAVKTKKKRF